ncbi:MAG: indolepyruvate oxidoreductase subunit beta family protein [Acetobacteraceae bacterium]|nr:indolepyruvate oxidoreductase subunit beta family protein [Acetobacteraceae bacterium]
MSAARPISVLISAMGGEGGGVMTDWIVAAAQKADLPVQGTSIPGVAQRTGATTYLVEIWPQTNAELGGRRPILAVHPEPAGVDVVIATELVEAARCCERGFVSPDRTLLIAATRRVYATVEKQAMGDGRFDPERAFRALREIPARTMLYDPDRLPPPARGASLNALSLGLLAGAGVLPIPHEAFRAAIRAGVAPETNLRGFEAGLALAAEGLPGPEPAAAPLPPRAELPEMLRHAAATLPADVLAVAEIALPRLVHYQSAAYARRYLERLGPVLAADPAPGGVHRLSAEVARQLALWMCYEDVVRVAQLKSSAARFAELRAEVRAKEGEPVAVTEFLKPGIGEAADLLPPFLGRPLRAWAERTGRIGRWHLALRVRSTSITGFLALFLLARLRRWRPFSARFAEEQAAIAAWLARILAAARRGDHDLALEIAACARLLKGYGDTYRRGREGFALVMQHAVDPARAAPAGDASAPGRVARAREAALADPEHKTLRATLASLAAPPPLARAAE